MRIAAGIVGILLGISSLAHIGLFGGMLGAATSWLGSGPWSHGDSRVSNLGQLISVLSYLSGLLAIVGGIVAFSNTRLGGIILAVSAFSHWYLLGFGIIGKIYVLPIGVAAAFAFFAARSALQAVPSGSSESPPVSPTSNTSSAGVQFDRAKWNALVQYDKDIASMAEKLRPLGQKWLDEFAFAFLALNDKQYLPSIEQKIMSAAKAEAEEKERLRRYWEEEKKAVSAAEIRQAQERKEQQERLAEARRKEIDLWRNRLWKHKAVVGGILSSLVVGGGYWYYQKLEAEKTIAAEREREAEANAKAAAQIAAERQRELEASAKVAMQYVEWLKEGRNPLLEAIMRDRTDIAEFAITKGADINASDGIPDGWSPLIFHAHSMKMLELLYAKGSTLISKNRSGQGLLHVYRDPAMVEFVLTKGGSDFAKDADGKTPLAFARDQREHFARIIAEERSKGNSKDLQVDEVNLRKIDDVVGLLVKYGQGRIRDNFTAGISTEPGKFADPFEYCKAVVNVDCSLEGGECDARYTGPKPPPIVASTLGGAVAWRCMNGKVMGCYLGASGSACEKPGASGKPPAGLIEYCLQNLHEKMLSRAQFGADGPNWSCVSGKPVYAGTAPKLDRRGYMVESWRVISAP